MDKRQTLIQVPLSLMRELEELARQSNISIEELIIRLLGVGLASLHPKQSEEDESPSD